MLAKMLKDSLTYKYLRYWFISYIIEEHLQRILGYDIQYNELSKLIQIFLEKDNVTPAELMETFYDEMIGYKFPVVFKAFCN